MTTAKVTVLHGPNLNLLGRREPELYGRMTLPELNAKLAAEGAELGLEVDCAQTNDEGALVGLIQDCLEQRDALVINPAAYTHTSVAVRDAILAIRHQVKVVEVHMTVPSGREWFRQQNMLADIVHGRVEGFGADSYGLALRAVSALIASRGD